MMGVTGSRWGDLRGVAHDSDTPLPVIHCLIYQVMFLSSDDDHNLTLWLTPLGDNPVENWGSTPAAGIMQITSPRHN